MNRHERRVTAALSRAKARALKKFIPDGFASNDPHAQPLIALRLAYRAWHAGLLTDEQARAVGCLTGKGS